MKLFDFQAKAAMNLNRYWYNCPCVPKLIELLIYSYQYDIGENMYLYGDSLKGNRKVRNSHVKPQFFVLTLCVNILKIDMYCRTSSSI